ncbi:MAG: hypothetical protein JO283_22100 [Bradyrhizobium sp.]|nr:hypothetical protein [Bradyrhizobium sp.]
MILGADDIASGRLVCSDLAGWCLSRDQIHLFLPSNRSLSPRAASIFCSSTSLRARPTTPVDAPRRFA